MDQDREATSNGPYHLIAPSYLTQIILVSDLRHSTEGIRRQQIITRFGDIALDVPNIHSSLRMIQVLRNILSDRGADTALQCLHWLDETKDVSLGKIMANVPNNTLGALFGDLVQRIIFTMSAPEARTVLELFRQILILCEPNLYPVIFKSCAASLPPQIHFRCLVIFTLPDFMWEEKQYWHCEFVICLADLYREQKQSVNRG